MGWEIAEREGQVGSRNVAFSLTANHLAKLSASRMVSHHDDNRRNRDDIVRGMMNMSVHWSFAEFKSR